jgi:hypothetical protein
VAEPATAAPVADHLDSAWHRGLLDELCAIERPSASPGERQAAQWVVARLAELGIEGRIEEDQLNGTFWWTLGSTAIGGVLAGLAGRRGRRFLGAALGAVAAAAAADEMPLGRRRLRSLLPRRAVSQVVAELGPADAERTVVVMAHHDAAHSGFLFSPETPETLERLFPGLLSEHLDTSPPLMWPVVGAPLLAGLGAATGSRRLAAAGAAVSAIVAAIFADIGRSEVVPGANDNGTGVLGMLAVARALSERPPENVRVLLASTSEEALNEGTAAFADRHFPKLPRESTFFLCLETIGSPHPLVLRGEGMLRMHEYPPRALALLDGLADELGIPLFPNLRTRNATDGIFPLAAGYECAVISSVTRLKQLANYHWPTDTPENVRYDTLADAIRLAEATVRRLDERWL